MSVNSPISKRKIIYRLKGWLNSFKEWLVGTSVKISMKNRLQNLPGTMKIESNVKLM